MLTRELSDKRLLRQQYEPNDNAVAEIAACEHSF
jgi:hypothetical protein